MRNLFSQLVSRLGEAFGSRPWVLVVSLWPLADRLLVQLGSHGTTYYIM